MLSYLTAIVMVAGIREAVLTGGPAKPAGPGGPVSPRSPCRRTEETHVTLQEDQVLRWESVVLMYTSLRDSYTV